MRSRMIRIGMTGLLVGVVVGTATLVGAPASAAPADRLTTLRGTVTAEDGHGLAGIRVTAGPYEGPSADLHALRSVRTDARGRYTLRITGGSGLHMKFEDPADRFFGATKDRFTARPGSTHRVDRVLTRVSVIAGTVRDAAGTPLRRAAVSAYYAASGERTGWSTRTDRDGGFHLRLEGGRYLLRFAPADGRAEWYGDAATRAVSPAVAVAPGGTTRGVDAVLD